MISFLAARYKMQETPIWCLLLFIFSRGTESGIETEKYSVLIIKHIFLYERKEY